MWDKIRKTYYKVNVCSWLVALIGLALVLLGNKVLPEAAFIDAFVGVYNYAMYLFTAIVAVALAAMVIRTIVRFRPIGLIWTALTLVVTALLYLTYFSLAGVLSIF